MLPLIGSIIGAGASLIGGAMNNASQKEANTKNYEAQKEFAQHGVRWKVEDAKEAGVHPIYALGAQTQSFSPSYVGDNSMGSGIAQAGQDIGRAVATTQTPQERSFNQTLMSLQLERGALENDLLRSQIMRNTRSGPAFPSLDADAVGKLMFHGNAWDTNPGTSDTQAIEDRYGDLVAALYGVGVAGSDVIYNRPTKSGAATPGVVDLGSEYDRWAAIQRLKAQLEGDPLQGVWDAISPPRDVYRGIYR